VSDRRDDVAAAILRHLAAHPDAADTARGIWYAWLGNSGASLADVSDALERLIRIGSVERAQRATDVVFRARRAGSRA